MTTPKKLIRQRFDVLEKGRTATHGRAEASQPIGGAGGNLLFIGLPGSGRKTLARAAAGRLGLTYAETAGPAGAAELDALAHAEAARMAGPASQAGLDQLLARSGQAIALTGVDLGASEVRERLRAAGKVFYLMSVAPILAKRLGDLSRLEELAGAVAAHEPFFLQTAHFVLPLDATPEEMADNVAEKACL